MKTTLDLPSDILRQVKVRAAVEGRKLKDLVADLLRSALAKDRPKTTVRKLKKNEMPILKGGHKAKPGQEITPQRVYEVLYGGGE